MDFAQEELKEVKTLYSTIPGAELVACIPAQVRVHINKTEYKRLVVCLQLPDNYPHEALVIEIKSKTLPENFLQGFTKLCDQEVKKVIGKAQIMFILKFVRKFLDETPLCVCSDEIGAIKRELIKGKDEIKLKQKTSQIVFKVSQNRYFIHACISVPEDYPIEQVTTQIIDQNLPDVLKIYMEAQAVEIARRCVQPPLKKNPKGPAFQPKPSLKPVCDFLLGQCVQYYPTLSCPCCKEKALPEDPALIENNPDSDKFLEKMYCQHLYHHGCLDVYLKTPPFTGGKKCPACGKRIFHEKWKLTPQLAEARWAHKEARSRELSEVTEFFD